MLASSGFTDVYSMEGGIRAWQGLTAAGAPEAGMAYFPENASAAELIGLAWLLEEGSRRFYSELPKHVRDNDAAGLFLQLAASEQLHEASLAKLYKAVADRDPAPDFPGSLLRPGSTDDVMEGGVRVRSALDWAKGRSVTEVLELALALETSSYDLYIKMERKAKDTRSKEVFSELFSGEKNHLDRLASLMDRKL